jgi:hypothetical protein
MSVASFKLQDNGKAPYSVQKLKRRKQTSIQYPDDPVSAAHKMKLCTVSSQFETACRNEQQINKKWAQHKVSQTCVHISYLPSRTFCSSGVLLRAPVLTLGFFYHALPLCNQQAAPLMFSSK